MVALMNRVGPWLYEGEGKPFKMPAVQGLQRWIGKKRDPRFNLADPYAECADVKNPDHLDFAVPPSLEPVLRDYQKFGFQWMKTMAHYRFGGILADDMGLGKTIQSIAFILSVLPEIRERANLHLSWRLPHCSITGLMSSRSLRPRSRPSLPMALRPSGLRLYRMRGTQMSSLLVPSARRDVERYAKSPFLTLILDEAQFFKITQRKRLRLSKRFMPVIGLH